MYGTTLCRKYWYLNLLDFLKEIGFKEGDCVKCSFIKEFPDGSKIYLLNYVDNMVYYGTDTVKLQAFERQLKKIPLGTPWECSLVSRKQNYAVNKL